MVSLLQVSETEALCMCDGTEPLGLSQQTISHHFKKLTEAGMVTGERHGTWTYYRIVPEALAALATVISSGDRACAVASSQSWKDGATRSCPNIRSRASSRPGQRPLVQLLRRHAGSQRHGRLPPAPLKGTSPLLPPPLPHGLVAFEERSGGVDLDDVFGAGENQPALQLPPDR